MHLIWSPVSALSYKWSNFGFGQEINILETKIRILSVALKFLSREQVQILILGNRPIKNVRISLN